VTPKTKDFRPWWWWINPWLYIKRRDIAYDDALDSLYELSRPKRFVGEFTPNTVVLMEYVRGTCNVCGKHYIKEAIERKRFL
jgi:hypothetical protein